MGKILFYLMHSAMTVLLFIPMLHYADALFAPVKLSIHQQTELLD